MPNKWSIPVTVRDLSSLRFAAVLILAFAVACSGSEDPVDNEQQNQNQNQSPANDQTNQQNDEEDYEVEITSPEPGDYESSSQVLIQGTVDGTDEVEVNGETAEVDEGVWGVHVLFDDGEVTATATAGDATDSVEFIVDTQRPEFTVETPDRGTVLDAEESTEAQITVSGQVTDPGPSGLLVFEAGGDIIDVDEDGSFETEASLQTGLNVLEMKAIDRAHNETTEHRAVIYGPLAEADAPIESAAGVDIDAPDGTDAIAEVIEGYITPEQIEEFIGDGFADEGVPVDITELDWDELDVDLVPHDGESAGDNGYLELELFMTDLYIEGTFDSGDNSATGSLLIEDIEMMLQIELDVDEEGELDVIVLDDFIGLGDITVNLDGEDQEWAEPLVAAVIVVAFDQFLSDLIEDNLYDPDVLTQEVEFLNRTIELTLILEDILITNRGISAVLGLEFPGDKYPAVPDVAGALHRPIGESLGGSVDRSLIFHSTRTTFDRALHGVWYSGLFHQQVGNEDIADADIPFELNASGIGLLLDDQIAEIHEEDTPVELRFRPLLSPVIEFGKESDGTVRIGDFLVDFLLVPEGGHQETLFLTLALQLDLDVGFEIGADEVDFDIGVQAEGDVVAQPVVSFDHAKTTELITDLLEMIPQLAASDLSIDPETNLEWATITDPKVVIHGTENTRISIGVELEPAQDFIEEDEVSGE